MMQKPKLFLFTSLALVGLTIIALILAKSDRLNLQSQKTGRAESGVESAKETPNVTTSQSRDALAIASSPVIVGGVGTDAQSAEGAPLNEKMQRRLAKLKELEHCLSIDTCAFSKESPWSYMHEINRAARIELLELSHLIVARDQAPLSREMTDQAAAQARRFLGVGNDEAKLAAIELLRHTPHSKDNLDAVINGLVYGSNVELYRGGLHYLREYVSEDASGHLDHFLLTAVAPGDTPVAREVASQAQYFMTAKNIARFKAVEMQMNPRSKARLYLRLAREEHRRFERGG